MRFAGLFLIGASLIFPLYWFLELFAEYSFIAVFSRYLGVVAMVLMSMTLLLATRLASLESLFGGLDRIYVLHKWLGIGALLSLILHNTLGAEIEELDGNWLSGFGASLGGTSLDVLQILILITVITAIPYKLWRWTHQFIGVFFSLGVIHYVLVPKPYSLWSPLGFYVLSFGIMGILSYLYRIFPKRFGHTNYQYQIESIEKTGSASAITLVPVEQGLKHKAGQFAFVSFDQNQLREVHPFTISQAPANNASLRFTIKGLGDYTQRLQHLLDDQVNVTITGPYGHFTLEKTSEPQVWIAGGVGITPFIAWAQALDEEQEVHLFYTYSSRENAPHLDELMQIAENKPNLQLNLFDSSANQQLRTDDIIQPFKRRWPNISVAFCGPKVMRKTFMEVFTIRGLKRSHFRYEEFELRSGVGLMKPINWLAEKLKQRFPVLEKYWLWFIRTAENKL